MKDLKLIAKAGFILGLITVTFISGCVIAPRDGYREGYWDRDHARWYHNHAWVDCGPGDMHCR
jgi:hypothetical protein